jgi:hypothetical protein
MSDLFKRIIGECIHTIPSKEELTHNIGVMKCYLRECGPIIHIDLNLNRHVPKQFFNNSFTRIFKVAKGKVLADNFLNYDISGDVNEQVSTAIINYNDVYISYDLLSLRCVALMLNREYFSEIFCIEDIDPLNHSRTIFNTVLPIQFSKRLKLVPLFLNHNKPFNVPLIAKLHQSTRILHDIGFYAKQIKELEENPQKIEDSHQKIVDINENPETSNIFDSKFMDNFLKDYEGVMLNDHEDVMLNDEEQVKTKLVTKIKRRRNSRLA